MSSTGLRFRTAADVRAIPNEQWEEWLRTLSVPVYAFTTSEARLTALHIVRATTRRMRAA